MEATPFFGRYQSKEDNDSMLFKDSHETPQNTIFNDNLDGGLFKSNKQTREKQSNPSLFALLPSPPTKLAPAASNVTLVDQESAQNVFSIRKTQSPIAASSPTITPAVPAKDSEPVAKLPEPLLGTLPVPNSTSNTTDHSTSQANTSNISSKSKSGKTLGLRQQSAIIDHLKKENFSLRMRILHLESEVDGNDPSNVAELQSQYTELKAYLAKVEAEFTSTHRDLKDAQKEGDQLRAELSSVQAELLAVQESRAAEEREREVLRTQNNTHSERHLASLNEKQKTIELQNAAIADLNRTVHSLKQQISDLERFKSANSELESELKDTRAQLESVRKDFDAQLQQLRQTERELSEIKTASKPAPYKPDHVRELQAELKRQGSENTVIREELDALKRQHAILKNENVELADILQRHSAREQELRVELERTQAKLREASNTAKNANSAEPALTRIKVAEMQGQIDELSASNRALEQSKKAIVEQRDRMEKRSFDMEREKMLVQKENVELEKQFFHLKDRYEQLKLQLKNTAESAELPSLKFSNSRAVHEREQLLLFVYDQLSKLFGDKFAKVKDVGSFSQFANRLVDLVGEAVQIRRQVEEAVGSAENRGLSQFQQLNQKMNSRIKQLEKFESIVRAAAQYQKRLKEACEKRQRVISAEKELNQSLGTQVKDLLEQIERQDDLISAQKRQLEKYEAKSAQQKLALRTASIQNESNGHSSARLKEMQIKLELERRGAQERVDELLEKNKQLERQLESLKRTNAHSTDFKKEYESATVKIHSLQRNLQILDSKHDQLLKEYKSTQRKLTNRDKLIRKALSRLESFNEQKDSLEKGLWTQATADLQHVLQHSTNNSLDYSMSTIRSPMMNDSPRDSSF